jgi:hypothetical protein
MVNCDAVATGQDGAAGPLARNSHAVQKADFIDDIIDIINGGGDDEDEDPEPATKP